MKAFVRKHFEEFVNRKNLNIADRNLGPEFVDHGADVPPIHVEILDPIAEDDRVFVHNHWTGTEAASGTKYEFSGIVIWRIAHGQLVERWAYLTPPQPAQVI